MESWWESYFGSMFSIIPYKVETTPVWGLYQRPLWTLEMSIVMKNRSSYMHAK